jgi:excisionase family DNA binding protein
MPRDDEILTIRELSTLLRVHPSTVYKLVKRGQIPSFRVGREWRCRKDAIVLWMAERSLYSAHGRRVTHLSRNGETASSDISKCQRFSG